MARFYDKVGYAIQTEVRPSVWEDQVVERLYFGETDQLGFRYQTPPDQISNNLRLDLQFDIMADPFAIEHYSCMKYIVYDKTRWEITSVVCEYPRIHIKVGGIYHGPTADNG